MLFGLLTLVVVTGIVSGYLVYSLMTIRSFLTQDKLDINSVLVLQDFETNLQTAESAQRGYIITGQERYLQPFHAALKKLPPDMRAMRKDPQLQPYAGSVRKVISLTNNKIHDLKRIVHIRQNQNAAAAQKAISSKETSALTQHIVGRTQSLINRELEDAIPLEESSTRSLALSLVLAPALLVIVTIAILLILRYVQRAIAKERMIEGTKNEFLSLASHQLRTPATNVKQYVQLVLEGYFGAITKEQRKALEIANVSNDSGINIINDLLNVAKIDLGQINIVREPTATSKIIKDVVEKYKPSAKQRKQTISYKADKDLQDVALDPTYFQTIVENLVDNASKYTPVGGEIKISAWQTPKYYYLDVTDNGVGIKKQDISKLFKKFSRLPNPLSDMVEGSGLGLYWVQRLAELHHGDVSVKSKPGEGSTFTVTLPLHVENDE